MKEISKRVIDATKTWYSKSGATYTPITIATELAKISASDADYDNFVIGKHERLPIPQREVDNNPNLTQNTNYEYA